MKKSSSHIWITALAVIGIGAGGVWAYETFYAATTIAPGAYGIPTPSSGNITLALPSGAKSWTSANVIGNGAAVQPPVPTSPTDHLQVTGIVKGSVATITWTDANGAVAISIISFT
jgi:hypothetical protein